MPSIRALVGTLGAAISSSLDAQEPIPPPVTTPPGAAQSTAPPPAAGPGGQGPELPPVVVTASRGEQDPFQAPYAINTVTSTQIHERAYRTTPQTMREIPSVMVQETSTGQGSPFIRGFTGFNTLMLIDGVRLNNSVFRSGPNQYWNTVDVMSIDRLEVLRGPAGAQYGSDAVGGTAQVFTKSPWTVAEKGLAYGGSAQTRYADAEDSIWGRGEISVGQTWEDGSHTAVLLGGDAKSFGDLDGGKDTRMQEYTSYYENAFDVKLEHWLDKDTRWVFLHQNVTQNDVPRTHSTVFAKSFRGSAVGTDRLRELDQDRWLTYLQYHKTNMGGAIDGVHANVSWHQQSENEDRTTSSGARTINQFRVGTLGAWLQLDSDLGNAGRLSYGFDWYHDEVDSTLRRFPTSLPSDFIQGPVADDASYDLVGVWLQETLPIADCAELTFGGRYTYAKADADSVRDPSTNLPISIEDSWDQFSGNGRMRVDLVEQTWNVYGGVSQGFRAPNLSDLTSFGTARSGETEIPAPGLDPENYLSYEVGTKVRTATVNAGAAWYYTDIEDQILRFPTGALNPAGQPIVTKDNVGDGHVTGVELEAGWLFCPHTSLFGAVTWQYGQVTNFETAGSTLSTEYVSRLMPLTTIVGVRWDHAESKCFAESLVMRAEDADKLSSGDVRDNQRIPPGGTPSYTVWNMRAGWLVDEKTSIDVGCDNITDVDYRVHGSGTNSPGRNFIVGMTVRF
jgi:hemoglobin/transferrin/lactoferrin receptor protein